MVASSTQSVSTKAILTRSLSGKCPNCGQGKIFRSPLRINHRCENCGMTLERGNGYYLGPLCLNYGFVAFFIVSPLILAGYVGWLALPLALGLAFIAAFALPVLFYQYAWRIWLASYYICLPAELHANRPQDSDDLLFEEEPRTRNS